ncbi:hypothetical protein PAXRUDRAFT_830880 [Paxillus rubicundulus Ve08.2h10]|uniref:Uncharacterized protein n=1 Tax=Paxillus rubicundulus Ve08.2h10 TaxID=930991 RepID=A0A0D0D4E1_9AGAM|nr:hypothetical protein PAXRUDRAFT_830880 [Paxillus rubicundulus Ve08.2h10]
MPFSPIRLPLKRALLMALLNVFLIPHVSPARVFAVVVHAEVPHILRTSLTSSRGLSKNKHLKVEYVWKAPWTIVKATFLLNRYVNLIGQSFIALEETGILSHGSQKFCAGFNLFCSFFMIFSAEPIHILVLMRTWTIWGCTYRAATWMIALYVTYLLVVVGMSIYGANTASFVEFHYLNQTGLCVPLRMPFLLWLLFLVTLLLDTAVLIMAMYSLRTFVRESQHLYPSPLLRLLARDAVLFYLASLFNSLYTIVCWSVYSHDPRSLLEIGLSFPLLSLVGQRLVLNLRALQTRHYRTCDLSREVDRQVAGFADKPFWQADGLWPNGVQNGGPLDPEWSGINGVTQTTDLEIKEVRRSQEEQGGSGDAPPITELYEVVRMGEETACIPRLAFRKTGN